jgi:hypothetical protein
MHTVDYRTPAVNRRIAEYREQERRAEIAMRRCIINTRQYGRMVYGDASVIREREMARASRRAIIVLCLAVFGALILATWVWAQRGSLWA